MPDSTPVLNLPYILPSQAQKHVTHNEAIRLLDVIVQLTVTARNISAPPTSPAMGDRYIIASGASGDWAGKDGQIALYENGAWQFFVPLAGWTAWVKSEEVLASYSGAAWTSQADGPFNVGQLGVSATPDLVNRLSVSGEATLLNHAGAGHQLKLNKAAWADTASLLFQTGFSGRAEMGTAGSDDFAIKVSADGTSFVTGLSIASDTGAVTLPVAAILGGQPADPAAPANGTIWLNSTTGEVKVQSAGASVVLASSGVSDGDKGAITVSGAVWQINAAAVDNAALADMPAATFKARTSAAAGAPEDISAAAAAEILPLFDSAAKGLVPASGGGSATFLRADGQWAAPAGGAASNFAVNGGFAVNQRGVSGTVTLAAGAYGHDRWKAGGSGCTYTFANSANETTVTISAGTLVQTIEGLNLTSGIYTLSWQGTAQAAILSPSQGWFNYASGPVTVTVTGGENLVVFFNAGSLAKVQLSKNSSAQPFQPRLYAQELALCQRYYQRLVMRQHFTAHYADDYFITTRTLAVPMRAIPTLVNIAAGTVSNVTNAQMTALSNFEVEALLRASAAGVSHVTGRIFETTGTEL